MAAADDSSAHAVRHLEAELRRHPEDRYPVQHATASFHLGTVHLSAGRARPAADALRKAASLFGGLPVERAKALNMLGVAHRTTGAVDEAATAFAEAERAFAAAGQPLEQAAAIYNLGLVALDQADREEAAAAFRRAHRLFADGGARAQAAAAGRELGAVLLTSGRPEEAVPVLLEAIADADRVGDRASLGAAHNVLGLAHLALGRPAEAAAAFHAAAGAHPRAVRPDGYAMAKANLALAHEQVGEGPRARLAARQARDTPAAPAPAREQAVAVLGRLPASDDDLLVVLDDEPEDRWPAVIREELARWVDATADEQRTGAAGLVTGQLARPERAVQLATSWLGVLLELPPEAMDRIVGRVVEALGVHGQDDRERFRATTASAMASFPVPQLLRIQEAFERTAAGAAMGGSWR
jgi:tetratricopeptide (TPR) repeat protein